jgi:hypothetical protein
VSHNQAMEPFTFVVVGAVVMFVLVGVGSFLAGGSLYDKIGEGGLSAGTPSAPEANSPLAQAERDIEIRQMLQARSDRQVRRGGEALDIDAEMALLEEPAGAGASDGRHDAGLTEEVRQLVMARNERRLRSGEEPMDVESEVRRTLEELDPDGR